MEDELMDMRVSLNYMLTRIHHLEGYNLYAAARKAKEEMKDIIPQLPFKFNDIKDKLQAKLDKFYE